MKRLLAALLAMATVVTAVTAAEVPGVSLHPGEPEYRRIRIDVAVNPDPDVEAYEVWFAGQAFQARSEATLHSILRVGSTAGLEQPRPGESFDDCWSDGEPAHRDERGMVVIAPETRRWSCSLTGMAPGVDQWIAVVPVDGDGSALSAVAPIVARTDASDERTPPPDTRPVLYALGSIVLSAIVLLSYLRWSDARRGRHKSKLAHIYVAPALVALAALTFYPILYGIWLAFTNADQSRLGDEVFIGLANFTGVFTSPGLLRVTLFTFIWAFGNTVAHVVFGVVLALLLNRAGLTGKTAYRTILLLPWAIPAYISVLAWNGMLQPDGFVNAMLGTSIDFIANAGSARVVVILVNIWLGISFMMMMTSGALQALSKDMFEAAEIDGVSRWDQLRYLTLPNLKSTLVPVSLLGFIWSFNMFNTIYLMTRGGPYVGFGEPGATDILVTYVYSVAFESGHYGIAAAWSVLIFLMLIGFSAVYVKKTRATEATA